MGTNLLKMANTSTFFFCEIVAQTTGSATDAFVATGFTVIQLGIPQRITNESASIGFARFLSGTKRIELTIPAGNTNAVQAATLNLKKTKIGSLC